MTGAANLLETRGRRLIRWIGAATLVIGLHAAAGGYAMMHQSDESDDESSGAIAIEIALESTADIAEPMNLAPGPLMEESMPTAPASQEVLEKVEDETSVEEMPSPAPEPEVVLQKQTQVETEPEEQKPEEQPSPQVQASEQTIAAPQTSAPPPIAAPVAEKAAAPQQGSVQSDTRKILTWQRSVVLHINKHKRYPSNARSRGIEGEAMVHFVMDRSGQVSAVKVTRSSGSGTLDDESLELLKRAAPLPRPPPSVVGEKLEFSVPIRFRIK